MSDSEFKFRLLEELSDDWLCLRDVYFIYQSIEGVSYANPDVFVQHVITLVVEGSVKYGDIRESGGFSDFPGSLTDLENELRGRLSSGDTMDHAWFDITDDGMAWFKSVSGKGSV